jgi:hypothetical protein
MAQYRIDSHNYLNQEKTLFETVMLADKYGNLVGSGNPSGMAVDAFGRARVSEPFTLYETVHRYQDNGKIGTSNSATGSTYSHDANSSSVILSVGTQNNSYVYRETNRVFPYQPGKSLLILNTFVMAPPQTGLRQRYGYFNQENGFFLEQDGDEIYFVRRSKSTGSVIETRVAQADWNIDTLLGADNSSPSQKTLDLTKAQILFTDIEWLGVGSVRQGFVIDGQFIHCHTWNHANVLDITYMTTATLPMRCEISNTANTTNTSNLRVICSTVISEGGYTPTGRPRAVSIPFNTPKDIPTAGTYVPIVSIRLKDSYRDAAVFPRSAQFFGVTNNASYKWKLVQSPILTGAVWNSAGADSPVEYDITATGYTGGRDLIIEYVSVAGGSRAASSQIEPSELYKAQLERDPFATSNVGYVYSLVATGSSNGNDAVGSISWEEL